MTKRWLLALFAAGFLTSCCMSGFAEGVTLKTSSIFSGADTAGEVYLNLLKTWQETTGNIVRDTSSISDEGWKTGVLNDFAAGNEADILFFYAKTGDSALILSRVVPIHEINQAYPGLDLPENNAIAESDGIVYAIPIRPFWEALFCNVDLFEANQIELPTTWERLETAIQRFNALGITPIAVSLSDVPHYLTEFCILSAGSPEDHRTRPGKGENVPESWVEGMRLIRRLNGLNAFPPHVNATTNDVVSQMFLDKRAAMQIEGSWFANGVHPENMNTTIVIPFPSYGEESDPTVVIGGISMGFYLSRTAWDDPKKRDAAVDLLAYLVKEENAMALGGFTFSGRLLDSYNHIMYHATDLNPPIQDAMDLLTRSQWFTSVPGIADGTVNPVFLWEELMAIGPFRSQ